MADVLSQSQIDELLNSFSTGGEKAIEEIAEQAMEKKLKVYDFRMPKKFTKEKLRILDRIFENYARLLSSYFTGLLRLYCKVSVIQIEEQRYYEFNNALPEYVMMSISDLGVNEEDVDDTFMITQISNPITFSILDRLLGGNGNYVDISRDFTEIETTLMGDILSKVCNMLKESWSAYLDINPKVSSIETNSRVLQTIAPEDVVILVIMEVQIKEVKNTISICIPAMNLEQIMEKFKDKNLRNSKKNDAIKESERRAEILNAIKNTPLDVTAQLCETQVDLYDILTLQVGDIIPLNTRIDSNVVLKVGKTSWFDGKLGVLNNKKAVKLDNILKK